MSLAMPSLTLLALDLFPHNRGLAASLQGGQQSLFSGITAGVLSPLLAGSALRLGLGALALMLCGLACTLAYTRTTKAPDSHA
jgi:DHA1 family bicyclomycin/chloramphenicol resistance-like MFS transporter